MPSEIEEDEEDDCAIFGRETDNHTDDTLVVDDNHWVCDLV